MSYEKTTRSKTVDISRDTHRQSSEMHLALTHGNRRRVNSLLTQGIELCVGKGLNCFVIASQHCKWPLLKTLIQHDPRGKNACNDNGISLLAYYASRTKDLSIIQDFIEMGANVNAIDLNGDPVLYFALKNPHIRFEITETLLAAGADPTISSPVTGNTLLHIAAFYALNVPLLRMLIEAGVDPTSKNFRGDTVLYFAVQTYFKGTQNNKTIIEQKLSDCAALRYLFELEDFKDPNFRLEWNTRHPQFIVASELVRMNDRAAFSFLLQTHLINPELSSHVDTVYVSRSSSALVTFKYGDNYSFSVVSHGLNGDNFRSKHTSVNFKTTATDVLEYLKMFTSLNFTLGDPDKMSPLTVFLYTAYEEYQHKRTDHPVFFKSSARENVPKEPVLQPEDWSDEILEVTKYMVENGVFTAQQSVEFIYPHLNDLRNMLHLPDALYAALLGGHIQSLRYLLPHYASPPLTLLLFVQYEHFSLINFVYPILAEWGPVPPGTIQTRLFQLFHVLKKKGSIDDSIYRHFKASHSKPMSLLALSRCAVRQKHASEPSPGHSLPELLSEKVPPGLKQYLSMEAPDNLRIVSCDDSEVAKVGNRSFVHYFH